MTPRSRSVFAALACLNSASSVTQACQCLPPAAARIEWERADAVFTGEVVALAPVVPTGIAQSGFSVFGPEEEATFRVEEVWKGGLDNVTTVNTTPFGCGPNFSIGKRYIVYAVGPDMDRLEAPPCGRTRALSWSDVFQTAAYAPLASGLPQSWNRFVPDYVLEYLPQILGAALLLLALLVARAASRRRYVSALVSAWLLAGLIAYVASFEDRLRLPSPIGRLGEPGRATAQLLRDLSQHRGTARLRAVFALAERPADAATINPALSTVLLSSDNADERRAAAWALRRLAPFALDALPALEQGLVDPAPWVATESANAIAAIGSDAAASQRQLTRALGAIAPAHLPPLTDEEAFELEYAYRARMEAMMRALGALGPAARESVPGVLGMAAGIQQLNGLGPTLHAILGIDTAVAVLKTELEHCEGDTRCAIAMMAALGELGPQACSAFEVVAGRLDDEDDGLRSTARYTIARMDAETAASLAQDP